MNDGDSFERAHDAALRFLSYRPRSEVEVRAWLGRRFPSHVVERVIRALTEESLLDDSRFAAQWKESRDSNKPRSAAAIRRELASRGVARDTAEAAVSDLDDEDAAYRAALRLAQRLEREDFSTFQRKLWGRLKRRGFTDSVARRTTSRLWNDVRSSFSSVNEYQLSPKSPLSVDGEEDRG
jgi:regulatory protein